MEIVLIFRNHTYALQSLPPPPTPTPRKLLGSTATNIGVGWGGDLILYEYQCFKMPLDFFFAFTRGLRNNY
jgi:hypothetical protein